MSGSELFLQPSDLKWYKRPQETAQNLADLELFPATTQAHPWQKVLLHLAAQKSKYKAVTSLVGYNLNHFLLIVAHKIMGDREAEVEETAVIEAEY